MSAADKIDNKLDEWLGTWPPADRSQQSWDAMNEAVQTRIAALPSEPGQAHDACFASPFPPQLGEGSLASARAPGGPSMSEEAVKSRSDEPDKPRSDEADQGAADKPAPSSPGDADKTASSASGEPADSVEVKPAASQVNKAAANDEDKPRSDEPDKPRRSLKDFAKRVSVAPPAPSSSASPSVPPSAPASTRTPLPITSRPVEAKPSDSGVVDLQAVREQSNSVPDAGTAPASAGLFDEEDDKKPAAAAQARKPVTKKSSMSPMFTGSIIALAAIAAVTVFAMRGRNSETPSQSAPAASAAAVQPPVATAEIAPATPQASAAALAAASAPGAAPGAMARNDEARPSAPGEAKSPEKTAKADEAKDKTETTTAETATVAPPPAADPGNLGSAIDKAVGGGAAATKPAETPTKASGPGNSDIPEAPSQGAIQGALGSVMGAARACVAGMDEPSRAQITFGSNGNVQNVSVSGAASGRPAAGCIIAAIKRAKVTPFQRSSFSVGATIRP